MLACEKSESIVDFPIYPSKLVLNCIFNGDSLWRFQVSKSLSVLDNSDIKFIDTAIIKLYENDILVEEIGQSQSDGIYFGNTMPKSGKQYRVEVSSGASFSNILSEGSLPALAQIDQINYTIIDSQYYDDEWGYSYGYMDVEFNIEIQDDAAVNNFYSIIAYYLDTLFIDDSSSYEVYLQKLDIASDDIFIDEASDWNEVIFTDELFNGQKISIKINSDIQSYQPGMVIYWTLINHSEDYFMYKKTFNVYQSVEGNPFAEPVQVFSNIKNGYGIFAGYSHSITTFQLP
jgi:hypothetical protein